MVRTRFLHTTSEVIDALGGSQAVEWLTGSKGSAISNWRCFNTFPANTYVVITGALARLGKRAPVSLWPMIERQGRRRRKRPKKKPADPDRREAIVLETV